MTKDEERIIIENYEQKGSKWCSESLNLNIDQVIYFANKHRLTKEYKKKLSNFNVEFINDSTKMTKEWAYVIGYLWADGAILNNSIRLSIIEEDGNSINDIMMSTGEWGVYKRKRKNRKPQMDFYITNKELSNFLKEHGKYPKTIESHQKILEFLPSQYSKYFIRGLIDGDGCYCIVNNKKKNAHSAQLYVSGRYEQDWGYLISFFKNQYGINFSINKQITKNGHSSSYIRCSSTKDIITFIKQIYDDNDKIYLERKFQKTRQILELESQIQRHFKQNRKYI